jgi:hypothetical protein
MEVSGSANSLYICRIRSARLDRLHRLEQRAVHYEYCDKRTYAESKVLYGCGAMVSTRNPYHECSQKHQAWQREAVAQDDGGEETGGEC